MSQILVGVAILVACAIYRIAQDQAHEGKLYAEVVCGIAGAAVVVLVGTLLIDFIATVATVMP